MRQMIVDILAQTQEQTKIIRRDDYLARLGERPDHLLRDYQSKSELNGNNLAMLGSKLKNVPEEQRLDSH
jgi:hypothetical protein